jgi:hypothetical protein
VEREVTPPDEREIGELVTEVRNLGQRFAEMREENAKDHAVVVGRLDKLSGQMEEKAPVEWVRGIDGRVDSLEGDRDERKGKLIVVAAILTIIVGPAIVGLFLIAAGVIA